MFDWVVNTHLFTTIFSFRKRSERKDKQSSDILLERTQKIFRQLKKWRLVRWHLRVEMGPFLIIEVFERYNNSKQNKFHFVKSYLKNFYKDHKWIYLVDQKVSLKNRFFLPRDLSRCIKIVGKCFSYDFSICAASVSSLYNKWTKASLNSPFASSDFTRF